MKIELPQEKIQDLITKDIRTIFDRINYPKISLEFSIDKNGKLVTTLHVYEVFNSTEK